MQCVGYCAEGLQEPWPPLCRGGRNLGDSVGKGKSQVGVDPLSLRKVTLELESPKIWHVCPQPHLQPEQCSHPNLPLSAALPGPGYHKDSDGDLLRSVCPQREVRREVSHQ